MGRNEILEVLRVYKEEYSGRYGIRSLGVFGSVARNQSRDDSDVDVIIAVDQPNLVALSHIRQDIEELVKRHVDLVQYRVNMRKTLKERIDREAVYV
jgi:hypothetical protein